MYLAGYSCPIAHFPCFLLVGYNLRLFRFGKLLVLSPRRRQNYALAPLLAVIIGEH
ncbi:MAG TPA: hypothetical protein VKK79_12965 [Candidatus Lokiarchaeia archaeon]|nr:hypothetical protein [Candidatus Lokiarchaeia archaeon]